MKVHQHCHVLPLLLITVLVVVHQHTCLVTVDAFTTTNTGNRPTIGRQQAHGEQRFSLCGSALECQRINDERVRVNMNAGMAMLPPTTRLYATSPTRQEGEEEEEPAQSDAAGDSSTISSSSRSNKREDDLLGDHSLAPHKLMNRNDAFRYSLSTAFSMTAFLRNVNANANSDTELIKALSPIFGSQSADTSNNAATSSTGSSNSNKAVISPYIEIKPPGPNPGEITVKVPRVGYSFYKTDPKTVPKALQLALQAGVRHMDVGTLYGSNEEIGSTLVSEEQNNSLERNNIFISHKVSNEEQNAQKPKQVKRAVKQAMKDLNAGVYLDCVSLHSPLTDPERRLASYKALLDMRQAGQIRLVGVCHFGVAALQQLVDAGLPPPSIIQLSLSPFNQHKDIVAWANEHGSVISCAAWSKLSSASGPQDGWAVVGNIAKTKSVTKAQIMVRWALQKGYLCVPRSGVGSKLECLAIQENSFHGVNSFFLTDEDMATLDGLDEGITAGRLGLLDGWTEADVDVQSGSVNKWDPTQYV
jgi:diketogulonate reductase-like aldo/keto reductase